MPLRPTLASVLTLAPTRLAGYPPEHRQRLTSALQAQNLRWQAPTATLSHIARLDAPETVAVVSGQQAGFLGGPALTVWKILTTIHLARALEARGRPAVPVFWIASEDHDFEEVRHTTILDTNGSPCPLTYPTRPPGQPSVGNIILDVQVETPLQQLEAALPRTEFTADLCQKLSATYAPGSTWCDAFARWLHHLFAPFGVILVDPRDEHLRRLTQPVLETVIHQTPELTASLVQQAQQYASNGQQPQVKVSPTSTTLFLEVDGSRTALLHDGNRFRLKSAPEKTYTTLDLVHILRQEPLRLTPSALLRPVLQDVLFPTVAQVVGPAEMQYLSQSQVIYDYLGIHAPARWARASVTLLESRHAKTLDKLGLTPASVLLGTQELARQAMTKLADTKTLDCFREVKATFEAELDRLKQSLHESDPSLAEALERGREKIFYQLNGLEQRFLTNQAQRHATLLRQIERATAALAPFGKPQERVLNILSFLVKYGPQLVTHSYHQLDFSTSDHQWLSPVPAGRDKSEAAGPAPR
ncbi:bacillithiol biosynthesis cysteine-adding enzyme BshC [Chloracidobacterium sp. MS 40/45]|uniref:bacillithiol biosynthesis cysteine-adding enzyme BshC n=1 Tax=Chloracidobacterium aggregatum TaxID=2851959 RepID=UPI001B8BA409|nr:bacillithiol biosynthesis cysteine-adding enzyme BshC [Chloracidobacterium aggregatum]QUW00026.1 bacillithiol biosynthesis cysteine-adding enzyme BshC [Chloracidobacterium sp. MS 40/45]